MAKQKRVKPLTELQERFVDAFLSEECMFDPIKAFDAAGYAYSMNKYSEAMKVLNSDAVVREINQRMAQLDTAYWINEQIIIKQLWKEAIDKGNNSTQSARINALVWIGKHIGMWQEKREEAKESQPTIKIVQYGIDQDKFKQEIETKEVEDTAKDISLPEGITVLNYNDGDQRSH